MVAAGPIAAFDEAAITRAMTGSDIAEAPYVWQPSPGIGATALLELDRLSVPDELDDISLRLLPGEIVGVSGLLGSGRTELALALFGMRPLALFGMRPQYRGTIRLDGAPVRLDSVQRAVAQRIAYVPEDRLTEGLFLPETIDRNIVATSLGRLSRFGLLRSRAAATAAADTIHAMAIATPTGDRPVTQLSGGNQQRVVIGRWLLQQPRLLILNGPTVGVDVGSKAGIHATIRGLARERGLGVLMISDDVPELAANCNRILLMHRGRLVAELPGEGPVARRERDLSDRLRALA